MTAQQQRRQTLGEWIARNRQALGLNKTQLAKLIGLANIGQITRWEEGRARPTSANMEALEKAYGVPYQPWQAQAGPPPAPDPLPIAVEERIDSLGLWIKTRRNWTGIGQADLAAYVGVDASTISRYESDDMRPGRLALEKLEKRLGRIPAHLDPRANAPDLFQEPTPEPANGHGLPAWARQRLAPETPKRYLIGYGAIVEAENDAEARAKLVALAGEDAGPIVHRIN